MGGWGGKRGCGVGLGREREGGGLGGLDCVVGGKS